MVANNPNSDIQRLLDTLEKQNEAFESLNRRIAEFLVAENLESIENRMATIEKEY